MTEAELKRQRVQTVHMVGIRPGGPSTVWGIHGASDFVIGICVGDTVLDRLPGEEVDDLTLRGTGPVGYLIYRGLPADHCKP